MLAEDTQLEAIQYFKVDKGNRACTWSDLGYKASW